MANENAYNSNVSLDEIVFENRNKEYGAYDLRSKYPKILTRSFLIGMLFFLLALGIPFTVLTIKQMNAADKKEANVNLTEILEEDPIVEEPKEEEPPPPPPKVEEEKIEIIQNVVPEPKKAPKVETPPPPISVQTQTTTGTENQAGVKVPNAVVEPPRPQSTGNKASTAETPPPIDPNKVFTEVEQTAEFPGGINAFRKKVENSFDNSVIEGEGGIVQAEVSFVVEKDGNITDVKASGKNSDFNSEAVRTVKSIKNKWTPAKVNGQAVRYRFKMPLKMMAPD